MKLPRIVNWKKTVNDPKNHNTLLFIFHNDFVCGVPDQSYRNHVSVFYNGKDVTLCVGTFVDAAYSLGQPQWDTQWEDIQWDNTNNMYVARLEPAESFSEVDMCEAICEDIFRPGYLKLKINQSTGELVSYNDDLEG